MFSSEIARLRKLGVQGVRRQLSLPHIPTLQGRAHELTISVAPVPGAQLPLCCGIRVDDVEGFVSGDQLRVSDSSRSLVSSADLCILSKDTAGFRQLGTWT